MKGIIMGAESVKAILDGRKTRHSFPIKPQPQEHSEVEIGMWSPTGIDKHGMAYPKPEVWGMSFESFGFGHIGVCPRYKVGEIVYVKEGWKIAENVTIDGVAPVLYESETPPKVMEYIKNWKSPFSMPEWASRIHLEITDIKAQRVQDISWDECIREGISDMVIPENLENQEMYRWLEKEAFPDSLAGIISKLKDAYASLWDSINAKKGFPLESNPWVFVYTFKVVQG